MLASLTRTGMDDSQHMSMYSDIGRSGMSDHTSLEQINTALRFKILALEQRLSAQYSGAQYDTLQHSIELQSQYDAVAVENVRLRSVVLRCQQVVQQLSSDNNVLQQSHAHIAQHVRNECETQHNAQIAAMDQTIAQLNETVERVQSECTTYQHQVETVSAELACRPSVQQLSDLQRRCNVDQAVIVELRNQLRAAKETQHNVQQDTDTQQATIKALQSQLDAVTAAHHKLQADYEQLKKQQANNADLLNDKQGDIVQLQQQVQELQHTVLTTDATLQQHLSTIQTLTSKNGELQAQLSESVPIGQYQSQLQAAHQLQIELHDTQRTVNQLRLKLRATPINLSPRISHAPASTHRDDLLLSPYSRSPVRTSYTTERADAAQHSEHKSNTDTSSTQSQHDAAYELVLSPSTRQLVHQFSLNAATAAPVNAQAVQQELQAKQQECEVLKAQVRSNHDQLDELHGTMADLERTVTDLQSQLNTATASQQSITDGCKSLYGAILQLADRHLSNNEMLNVQQMLAADMPVDVAERNRCMLVLHVMDSALSKHTQNAEVADRLQAQTTANQLLTSKFDDTKLLLNSTASALNDANQRIAQLSAQLAAPAGVNDSAGSAPHVALIAQLKDQNDSVSQQLAALRHSIGQSGADVELKQQYAELSTQHDTLQQQYSELQQIADVVITDLLHTVSNIMGKHGRGDNDMELILRLRTAEKVRAAYSYVCSRLDELSRIRRAFEVTVQQIDAKYAKQCAALTAMIDKQNQQLQAIRYKIQGKER